jgi:ElaA protein
MTSLRWVDRAFDELSVAELYAIVSLRERVFIVEQNCIYLDADGYDPKCRHLWAEDASELQGEPVPSGYTAIRAYLRVVPAGLKYPEVSLGRVIVTPAARGTGLGKELVRRGIAACAGPIKIAAQAYLEKFYAELGFVRTSEVYDDDGIPHVDMLRAA